MFSAEMIQALQEGKRVRRPIWPPGDYVEAEGEGSERLVKPGTMFYVEFGGGSNLWLLRDNYLTDFNSDDFEELT